MKETREGTEIAKHTSQSEIGVEKSSWAKGRKFWVSTDKMKGKINRRQLVRKYQDLRCGNMKFKAVLISVSLTLPKGS